MPLASDPYSPFDPWEGTPHYDSKYQPHYCYKDISFEVNEPYVSARKYMSASMGGDKEWVILTVKNHTHTLAVQVVGTKSEMKVWDERGEWTPPPEKTIDGDNDNAKTRKDRP